MPNKLTINHIMNMIQAHNELCAYAPQAHRLGAYIEIKGGDIEFSGEPQFLQMFSDSYIFTSKQLWDLLWADYTEDFIKVFVNAKFETMPTTSYLEANFEVAYPDDKIIAYRVIVSIWER